MTNAVEKERKIVEKIVKKARVLAEALPFIQKFRGSTVVIKYGGNAMIDPKLKEQVIHDIVLMENVGINPVIVHGGGPEITAVMNRMGLKAEFYQGQRVTDADTLEITEMVLAGKLNGEIVSLINRAGGRAVGLSGKDAQLILARKMQEDSGKDMGFVGDVSKVNPEIVHLLNQNNFIPVISPIGADEAGQTYNINADFVAAEIAAALKARKLVLLTDVLGILRDHNDEATLIQSVKESEVEGLIRDGIIGGGMIPKVRACLRALHGGVRKTHILDGRLQHSLLLELFTTEGIGTMLHVGD
ncbi:acetylglutamate kinase [Candidatus Sumerlaeota bacterium]|nr:acetylglutamate kinase [Candidatus Sumerlaeota bacterium]